MIVGLGMICKSDLINRWLGLIQDLTGLSAVSASESKAANAGESITLGSLQEPPAFTCSHRARAGENFRRSFATR
jgi:hypothetical protein